VGRKRRGSSRPKTCGENAETAQRRSPPPSSCASRDEPTIGACTTEPVGGFGTGIVATSAACDPRRGSTAPVDVHARFAPSPSTSHLSFYLVVPSVLTAVDVLSAVHSLPRSTRRVHRPCRIGRRAPHVRVDPGPGKRNCHVPRCCAGEDLSTQSLSLPLSPYSPSPSPCRSLSQSLSLSISVESPPVSRSLPFSHGTPPRSSTAPVAPWTAPVAEGVWMARDVEDVSWRCGWRAGRGPQRSSRP